MLSSINKLTAIFQPLHFHQTAFDVDSDTIAWWYMSCGRALGMLNGNLIEYDSSTLAPLGLVVGADELVGKKIGVINSGLDADTCAMMFDDMEGMEGMDCAGMAGDLREQAVVLLDKENGQVTVVQPNEDVSILTCFSSVIYYLLSILICNIYNLTFHFCLNL
jgi:hypothetical protein